MISSRFLNRDVEIKRLSYSGTPKKGSYATTSTVRGYLRPLSEVQASENGFHYGQAFALLVDVLSDLKETDEVVIETITYKVQGVANHDRGGLAHKRALITLNENA